MTFYLNPEAKYYSFMALLFLVPSKPILAEGTLECSRDRVIDVRCAPREGEAAVVQQSNQV